MVAGCGLCRQRSTFGHGRIAVGVSEPDLRSRDRALGGLQCPCAADRHPGGRRGRATRNRIGGIQFCTWRPSQSVHRMVAHGVPHFGADGHHRSRPPGARAYPREPATDDRSAAPAGGCALDANAVRSAWRRARWCQLDQWLVTYMSTMPSYKAHQKPTATISPRSSRFPANVLMDTAKPRHAVPAMERAISSKSPVDESIEVKIDNMTPIKTGGRTTIEAPASMAPAK